MARSELLTAIVPAHNESAVIDRFLTGLLGGCPAGAIEVLVVANGCTDATVVRAREYASRSPHRISVLDLPTPSKTAAIRAGVGLATGDVVAVVDADILVDWTVLNALAGALRDEPEPRVGALALRVDTTGASRWVRAYYRVWTRLPYVASTLVGSGLYAVNAAGLRRLAELPDIVNDDGWARRRFCADERLVGDGSFTAFAPRTVGALVRRRARIALGNRALDARLGAPDDGGNRGGGLGGAVRSRQVSPGDAAAFALITLAARILATWRARTGQEAVWSQDATTRQALGNTR